MNTTKKNQVNNTGSVKDAAGYIQRSSLSIFHWLKTKIVSLRQNLFPLEIIALASLATALSIIKIFSVHFYLPNGNSTAFALNHYVNGSILASVIVLLFSWKTLDDKSMKFITGKLFVISRHTVAFLAIVFLHFNFKLWAQLINPLLFDDLYQSIDQMALPLYESVLFLNNGFSNILFWLRIPNLYHHVFVFMFYVSFVCFSLISAARPHLGKMTSTVALVLAIGGLSYSIAPAWGPFVHSYDSNFSQKIMSQFQLAFIKSGGTDYSANNFISPLAAMPSLHAAHTFVLYYYARTNLPWLSYLYLPLVFFIFTEAIASKWHYMIDIPFGLLVASASISIAKKLHATQSSIQ